MAKFRVIIRVAMERGGLRGSRLRSNEAFRWNMYEGGFVRCWEI